MKTEEIKELDTKISHLIEQQALYHNCEHISKQIDRLVEKRDELLEDYEVESGVRE